MDNTSNGSLRYFDTLNDWIGRIRAELSADTEGNRVILLLEGKSDELLFKQIYGKDNERIVYLPTGGVQILQDVIERLHNMKATSGDPQIDSVVAVRDRDYTNPGSYPDHVFAYDGCAMELMILHCSRIQDTLRPFYLLNEEEFPFPLGMMRHIAPFSLLRKENALFNLKIAFQKDKPKDKKKCNQPSQGGHSIWRMPEKVTGKKLSIPDINALFKFYVKDYYPELNARYAISSCADGRCQANNNTCCYQPSEDKKFERCSLDKTLKDPLYTIFEGKSKPGTLSDDELWNITNGHDICDVLGQLSSIGSGALNEVSYRNLMLVIYGFDDFEKTSLYGSLSNYKLPSNGGCPFKAP